MMTSLIDVNGDAKFEILIVDDLKENLLALSAILERDDVVIRQALSGKEALELLFKHEFCLAILDVKMPVMSGFELAELIRGTKKTKRIPIIFVTATAKEQNFSFKGYESGAVDFLLKPLDVHAVKSKVNVFVELYRQKKELDHQVLTISKLLNDLNAAKVEAERANASKTEFLAHMSHEIRTPIGAILGFSELMKGDKNTAEEAHFYTTVIERNSHQLLRLIDDILDLSKVEAGKISVETIDFSIADMLIDLESSMSLRAKEKNIEFKISVAGPIPSTAHTDPYRLRQILDNVSGNAIKFTEKGLVEVRVSHDGTSFRFEVIDSGLGITAEQSILLFQPFAQADKSTTRKFGGTGLGLILSRRLAENLGGALALVSGGSGDGCTFLIEIKSELRPNDKFVGQEALVVQNKKAFVRKDGISLRGLAVLLVEDSADNQILITTYLKKEGAQVTCASDGAEGLRMALTNKFDVVLMDIQLPILDGHHATRQLRASGYLQPIVALTAHAMTEEQEKAAISGFTDFLTKPIERDLLILTLARYNVDLPAKRRLTLARGPLVLLEAVK